MHHALRRPAALLLALALGTAIAAAQSAEPQRHPYTRPHVLRFTMAEEPVSLNQHVAAQTLVAYLSQLTMAYLLRSDAHDGYVPELATAVPSKANGGISADGKTIVYHLRRDAKWSDGVPFGAADVAFSIKTVLNPANEEQNRYNFEAIGRVETPDPATVILHLTRPDANIVAIFASNGANVPLLPEHLLKDLPDINHAAYNALPVGIGPFKFSAWRRGDAVEMVADPLYFRGRPKLDRIVYKIIPDRNTALAQLQTHELDMWITVPGAYLEKVATIPGLGQLRREQYGWGHLDFNVEHPAVREAAVRQALRYALDRETIRVKIGRGLNKLSETPFSDLHPAHMSSPIPLVPFDLAKANALLDGAGWQRGADGVRAKNGVRLSLTFGLPTGSQDTDQSVELIRSWWKEIGVEIEVQHFAEALFFGQYAAGGIVQTGKTDVVMYGWTTNGFGDLTNLFACTAIPPKGQNNPRFCDPAVDAALAKQRVEYDPVVRRRYSDIVQRRIFEGAPTIITSLRRIVYAYNSDLKNFDPNISAPFDNILAVDI